MTALLALTITFSKSKKVIVDKSGKGAFFATDLDVILRSRGIANLVITGVTTDVCVSSTMREANDRGYECVVLEDCTAATDHANHVAALNSVKMSGGIFGTVSRSDAVLEAIELLDKK
jgi:nicotinamidase-related amidase